MVTRPSILIAEVMHKRTQPKVNAFRYSVYYLAFPLSQLKTLAAPLLCSLNRFNLFSYYQKDHGNPVQDNDAWARQILQDWELADVCDGEIVMVTMPRILGYAFNPVTFWFCLDKAYQIRAVLSEVNNTFGEKHIYVSFHDDRRVIHQNDWMESQKVFHVSPFMKIEGIYRYRFVLREDKIAVWINHITDAGDMLYTSMIGKRYPLSTPRLLWCFFRYPLVTVKVISLIHWQALKLAMKGITYHRKPLPPSEEITR